MSALTSVRKGWQWAVPAAALLLVVGGFAARPLLASADTSGLPPMTADQLVAAVTAAKAQPLSGTVVYTADLGLPDISTLTATMGGGMTTADPVNLLSGTSTLRVWTDASARSRISLLGTTSEYSVVHDAKQAWTYDSATRTATHYTLSGTQASTAVPGELPTPTAAADDVLAQVKQFATVSLDAATSVAGRAAYQLIVTPKTTATLVARIAIAIDASTDTPLRVQVWSTQKTAAPALELGFTDITFATPSDGVLAWSTPAGATVKDVPVPLPSTTTKPEQGTSGTTKETVAGTGFASVVTLTGVPVTALSGGVSSMAGALASAMPTSMPTSMSDGFAGGGSSKSSSLGMNSSSLYNALTTAVAGGRLLSSNLVSILVLNDGRVLAGAVPAATLTAMAG